MKTLKKNKSVTHKFDLSRLSSRKVSKKDLSILRNLVYNNDYDLLELANDSITKTAKIKNIKMLVIGNSGCGKTYFSTKMGEKLGIPVIHMDKFFFRTGGYTSEYFIPQNERDHMIKLTLQLKTFIIEGSSVMVGKKFLPYCNQLVFIDYPWQICRDSILNRPLDPGMKSSPEDTKNLLDWAGSYYKVKGKHNISNYQEHKNMFNKFKYSKYYIIDRETTNKIFLQ